jgi:hypothetical protein
VGGSNIGRGSGGGRRGDDRALVVVEETYFEDEAAEYLTEAGTPPVLYAVKHPPRKRGGGSGFGKNLARDFIMEPKLGKAGRQEDQKADSEKEEEGANVKWGKVAAFIGAATLVCWLLSDQLGGIWHFVVVWLALCGLLLEVAWAGVQFRKASAGWQAGVWIVYAFACFQVGNLERNKYLESLKEVTQPSRVVAVVGVPQPDYIDGTQFTHKQMEDFFPFGYAILYPNENKRFRYEVFKTGQMEWTIDLAKVKVETDFTAGKVTVTLPKNWSASGGPQNNTVIMDNSTIKMEMPLTLGNCNPVGIVFGNTPCPYLLVLSVDQRNPVFAMGYRILTKQK